MTPIDMGRVAENFTAAMHLAHSRDRSRRRSYATAQGRITNTSPSHRRTATDTPGDF